MNKTACNKVFNHNFAAVEVFYGNLQSVVLIEVSAYSVSSYKQNTNLHKDNLIEFRLTICSMTCATCVD